MFATRNSAVIVDSPELPATGAGDRAELGTWWDAAASEIRDALALHAGAEVPPWWAACVERSLRGWADDRAARLLALAPSDRVDFLVSLRPILVSLEEGAGQEAALLLEQRLGPWLRRRAEGFAGRFHDLDPADEAAEALSVLRLRVCRRPAPFVPTGRANPQSALLALLRTTIGNLILDRVRARRPFADEVEVSQRHDETAGRILEDLGRELASWEDALAPADRELYARWLGQDDEAGRFWSALRIERGDLHARKSSFYRRLDDLRERMALVADRPATKALRAQDLVDLREVAGLDRSPRIAA